MRQSEVKLFENFYFGTLKLNSIHISQRFTVDSFGNYASCGQRPRDKFLRQYSSKETTVLAAVVEEVVTDQSNQVFFIKTRSRAWVLKVQYDDVKRDADATVTDTAPAGAASLILSPFPRPALGFFRQVHLLTRSHFSRDPLSVCHRSQTAGGGLRNTTFASLTAGSQDPLGRTQTTMRAPGCGRLALPLLLLAAAALAEGHAKGLKEGETPGNFMEDEQWLSSISQYSGKIKHWNRFRDVSLQRREGRRRGFREGAWGQSPRRRERRLHVAATGSRSPAT
ncbi:hypothetical protein HPG69_015548 [Diceros bicornis minor]|uniref:Testican-2 n=1 Tax=Diceros bicornis minor TaxID=77932 RepID=A0A7J7FM00_DICBM|nr:hypothetical protein HPG69_015548 [Diceros bicornis minor]